jgi:hypothetical protein
VNNLNPLLQQNASNNYKQSQASLHIHFSNPAVTVTHYVLGKLEVPSKVTAVGLAWRFSSVSL